MARRDAEAEVDFHMDSEEEDDEDLMNEADGDEDEEVSGAPAAAHPPRRLGRQWVSRVAPAVTGLV